MAALFAAACGKKGEPQPPLPKAARAVSDLLVEQEAAEALLTFSFPDRLLSGAPLTDLQSIEVYRVVNPSAVLTSARPPAAAPSSSGGRSSDRAPAAEARRAAANVRLAEEAFYRDAERVAVLELAALAEHTRGATIVYRDPLERLLAREKPPSALAYAVVSVRRGGKRSPLSNIVALSPDIPPGAPAILAVTLEERRICLEWLEPAEDLLGRKPAHVGGYLVYRRALPEEEYGPPLNREPVAGTSYVDTAAPYGATLVYTLRATLPGKPRVEGAPATEAAVDYRDVFAPPRPARLLALSEEKLVRLVWDPVAAPDLAGYVLFRAEADGPPARLNKELIPDSFFTDESVAPRRRYRYTVCAVDTAGNQSPPSSEAIAEPF
ncbi:MAG: fibronectin type III domain-containing protein [Thermoanaerobaculia bacterium]